MKQRNPRMGWRKIAEHIAHTFGVEIDKDVVRRILDNHYVPTLKGDGPSWLTTIGHIRDSLWSMDLFRCESIFLQSFWVMVVMDICTRRIIGFGVERGYIDGVAVCRMFNHAIAKKPLPKYLSTDNDPLFRFHRWRANLKILDIEEIKAVPFTSISHPFVERLIGSLRRELLDRLFFWNQLDLDRKLLSYADYYNMYRCHSGLAGAIPTELGGGPKPPIASFASYQWMSHCHGLFQTPVAA
jgi:putative transposase